MGLELLWGWGRSPYLCLESGIRQGLFLLRSLHKDTVGMLPTVARSLGLLPFKDWHSRDVKIDLMYTFG